MITDEQLINIINDSIDKRVRPSFKLGTIVNNKVKFDGENTESQKTYKKLDGATLNNGDRVLLAYAKGTYVILGKLT